MLCNKNKKRNGSTCHSTVQLMTLFRNINIDKNNDSIRRPYNFHYALLCSLIQCYVQKEFLGLVELGLPPIKFHLQMIKNKTLKRKINSFTNKHTPVPKQLFWCIEPFRFFTTCIIVTTGSFKSALIINS